MIIFYRQLGNDLTIPGGVTTIDAKGQLVTPGGIDLSTSFSTTYTDGKDTVTTADDFYSGSRAALAGGTTMFGKLIPLNPPSGQPLLG